MKLAKSLMLVAIVAALAILGAVDQPKELVLGFAIGFFVGHIIEILILTKLLVLNKVSYEK